MAFGSSSYNELEALERENRELKFKLQQSQKMIGIQNNIMRVHENREVWGVKSQDDSTRFWKASGAVVNDDSGKVNQ